MDSDASNDEYGAEGHEGEKEDEFEKVTILGTFKEQGNYLVEMYVNT